MSELHANVARESNTCDVLLTCGHYFTNQLLSFRLIRMVALWGNSKHQPHSQTLAVSNFKHKLSVHYDTNYSASSATSTVRVDVRLYVARKSNADKLAQTTG